MYQNPYQVLGVSENATDNEIKSAYRKLSRKYHPDSNLNAANKSELQEKYVDVQHAYEDIISIRQNGYPKHSSYGRGASSYQENYGGFSYNNPFGNYSRREAGEIP